MMAAADGAENRPLGSLPTTVTWYCGSVWEWQPRGRNKGTLSAVVSSPASPPTAPSSGEWQHSALPHYKQLRSCLGGKRVPVCLEPSPGWRQLGCYWSL